MSALRPYTVVSVAVVLLAAGLATTANAVERFAINVVNDGDFRISVELRDKMCGNTVLLRDQLDAGEAREIEICANADGIGGLRATVGSGCSQVKRMEILDIQPGTNLTF